GVVTAGGASRRIEARIARGKVPGSAEGGKGARVEAQGVPVVAVEVEQRVRVRRAVLAEDIAVLPRAAGELVVAAAPLGPAVAGVGEDRVVAAAADERVVATGTRHHLSRV